MGSQVRVSQCQNKATCLKGDDLTLLDFGLVRAAGAFTLKLDDATANGGPLVFDAQVQLTSEPETIYRTVDFGLLASEAAQAETASSGLFRGQLPRASVSAVSGIVIDASSEGAVNAIDLAGLENVKPDDPEKLTVQVRADARTSGYAGATAPEAAELADEIASDLFFLEPRFIATSPDGLNVYIADREQGAIAVLEREANGTHSFVEVQRNNVAGVERLDGANAIAVSPDGHHVYATSKSSVVAFARDITDGTLALKQIVDVSLSPISASSPTAIALSPDGANVYVSTSLRVVVFARDGGNGTIAFLNIIPSYVAPAPPNTFLSLVVSDDGKNVYGDAGTGGVARFNRNLGSGALTFQEVTGSATNPVGAIRQVVMSSDDRSVYSMSRGFGANDNTLTVYQRSLTTGALTLRQVIDATAVFASFRSFFSDLEPYSVAISPGGDHVYLSSFFPTRLVVIAVFERDQSTGDLASLDVVLHDLGNGNRGSVVISNNPIISKLAISPDGDFFYTGGGFKDPGGRVLRTTAVFDRATDGGLTFRQNARAFYVRTGALSFVGLQRDGVSGTDGLDGGRSVAVSPDGRHAYAMGANENALAVFTRNATTGALSFVEVHRDGVNGVDGLAGSESSVTVSPDGGHVYVAGRDSDAIAVFARNQVTGRLTFMEAVRATGITLDGVVSVAVSPDGKHVYTAARFGGRLGVFARNAVSGHLTFVQALFNGAAGTAGLNGVFAVTVSPDGAHVYTAAFLDDAVAAFARNSTTGALTFVEVEKEGLGGAAGLDGASSVLVSPDAKHVYVGAGGGDTVAVFSRNVTTGALTFVEFEADGVGGVDGLNGIGGLVASPYGGRIYAAGQVDDAVAVFDRNPATGALTFVQVRKDGLDGVDGLNGARSVSVSPDGRYLYAAGIDDDALATFAITD